MRLKKLLSTFYDSDLMSFDEGSHGGNLKFLYFKLQACDLFEYYLILSISLLSERFALSPCLRYILPLSKYTHRPTCTQYMRLQIQGSMDLCVDDLRVFTIISQASCDKILSYQTHLLVYPSSG